jgi:hypothetical protein
MIFDISYKYAYALGCLYFLAVWAVLFLRMKDERKSMLRIGLIWMWVGVMCEYLWWLRDWWHPQNVIGTFIGVEDFIISFTHFNVTIFVYKYVFKKASSAGRDGDNRKIFLRMSAIILLVFGPSFVLYYLFSLPSYIATGSGLLFASALVVYKRKDLILPGLLTAGLFFIITFVMFLIGSLVYPNVIVDIWYPETAKMVILGYPVIDMIWYLVLGFLMGGVYEYVFQKQFVDSKRPSFKEDMRDIYLIGKRFVQGKELIGH